MLPTVTRTWGRRGDTPILKHRLRHREKVSAIGAISLSPQRRHVGLYQRWYPNQNVRQPEVLELLRHLCRSLRGRLIILWDRANPHRCKQVKDWCAKHPRVVLEPLPAYAPDLDAVDYLWAYLKAHPLANHGLLDTPSLLAEARRASEAVQQRQDLLRGFLKATGLPLRLP